MRLTRFASFAWIVLGYNILVILWGAYVRATGSGAGCGSHWPLCNGVVIPRSTQLDTIIEFTHRMTSGFAFILVVLMFIWAMRSYSRGSPVRLGAGLSLLFIVTESLLGAGLVLFEWVANDASQGRVISMSLHLVNTFLLLASITLTGWWASGGKPIKLRGQGFVLWVLIIALVSVLILSISGAITALGDTLFPSASLAEGIQQDFSSTAHFVIRLRIWHPILAMITGLYLFFISGLIIMFSQRGKHAPAQPGGDVTGENSRSARDTRTAASALIGIILLQLFAGLINLALLAPTWMQLIHLLLADLVWITLVLLAAISFADTRAPQEKTENLRVSAAAAQPKVRQISRVVE